MSDDVLETYVRRYITEQSSAEVHFAWQGGEPTLLGIDFFRKAVSLQRKYAAGKTVLNAIQTNGTLLNDRWGEFLAENAFLVGLSVDGPRALHDRYRVDKGGKPTFDDVMEGLSVLQRHGVEFNTLTVVHRANAKHPLEVYRFLKGIGSGFIQFIPLVERRADPASRHRGLDLAPPPRSGEGARETDVTPWSVEPGDYGDFLVRVFDEWVRSDVGSVYVQLFDVALGNWIGVGSSLCVFAESCGRAVALEHNGDIFSCDHYVYPEYRLGNLMNQSLGSMLESAAQAEFGKSKKQTLPRHCRECEVRFACNGECPKHRFALAPDGEAGLNYLCPAYKKFFGHIDPYMREMGRLLREGRPPSEIMGMLEAR